MKRYELIPPPKIVRQRLTDNVKEGRLLRDLLKLSVRAAENALATEAAEDGQAHRGPDRVERGVRT